MLNQTVYRLNEYLITEYGVGHFGWAAHFGFGIQRRGPCLLRGKVLVIGKPTHEEIGYLINEFYDRLKKSPGWTKTKYYCHEDDILPVRADQKTSSRTDDRRLGVSSFIDNAPKYAPYLKAGDFRLSRYQITVKPDGRILWSTHRGRDLVVKGPGVIIGHILILESKIEEKQQSRKQFVNQLKSLELWEATDAWCQNLALRSCSGSPGSTRPETIRSVVERDQAPIVGVGTVVFPLHQEKENLGGDQHKKRNYNQDLIGGRRGAGFVKSDYLMSLFSWSKGKHENFSVLLSKIKIFQGFPIRERLKAILFNWKLGLAAMIVLLAAVITLGGIFWHHRWETFDTHHGSHKHHH